MTPPPHIYVECDVPPGLTLTDWRRAKCVPRRPPAHRRIRSRLRALVRRRG